MDMNEFLKDALSGRADVNAKGEHGMTALMRAAWKGRAEIAGMLNKKEGAK